jgi:hypothetical protein
VKSVVRWSRATARRGLPGLLVLATLAACGAGQPKQISFAQFSALQQQLDVQSGDASGALATPAPGASPGPSPIPPRNDAERRERAAGAIAAGVKLGTLIAVGDGTRYAMGLATSQSGGKTLGPNLVLFDVSAAQGVLLGEHDFGLEQPGAKKPARLGRTMLLDAPPDENVALAELLLAEGEHDPLFGVCGWWLHHRKPAFLCVPRLTPDSRFEAHQGQLVESWPVDAVGQQVTSKAGTRSGRQLRFVDGHWQETDSFRCLGRPIADAFKEAGTQTLLAWQQDTVRRLTKAATRAAESLDTDLATSRLEDALAADGCAPDVWRVLGRLQFEAGRPQAAATLAVALALSPRDDAVLVDLADALAVLDSAKPQQLDSWHSAVAILGDRAQTRAWVEGPNGKSPRALAMALYRTFLERTSESDEWVQARRRKVQQKIDALEGGERRAQKRRR